MRVSDQEVQSKIHNMTIIDLLAFLQHLVRQTTTHSRTAHFPPSASLNCPLVDLNSCAAHAATSGCGSEWTAICVRTGKMIIGQPNLVSGRYRTLSRFEAFGGLEVSINRSNGSLNSMDSLSCIQVEFESKKFGKLRFSFVGCAVNSRWKSDPG
jgi:hypothetical protein